MRPRRAVGSAVEWLVGLIGLGGRCERGIWCFDAGHCVDQYRRVKAETRRDCGKESGDAEIARFAEKRFSASFLDLAQQPLEVFLRVLVHRQRVHGVLDRDSAEVLQPAPDVDPEICRLCRQLMDEQKPAVRESPGCSDIHGV